jgi:hypothetical protein
LKATPDITGEESRGGGEAGQEAVQDELPEGRIGVDVAPEEASVAMEAFSSVSNVNLGIEEWKLTLGCVDIAVEPVEAGPCSTRA